MNQVAFVLNFLTKRLSILISRRGDNIVIASTEAYREGIIHGMFNPFLNSISSENIFQRCITIFGKLWCIVM